MEKLAEKLAELAEKYGPYTIEMARSAATVEAWKALISAIVFSMVFSTSHTSCNDWLGTYGR